ncbi:TetR/AcrR family transcriptional regulator [Desulfuribacillus alkaliarsenatis]|uniref:Transcriptional regulator n=1 Tax=Desulfuribacillus alkaliarsenatis TaxID=766136 RepID=A0A1E5G2E1_9FIRM|nr:TetR/AcrR family transcriptional regulator [Desulfuribacillus alkaliarsenatis]OEF97158.1 transcriptional regulator [Desulfuribacillus alkaliarsenatis]
MEHIKADILQAGKELFSEKGFKDTSVSDITKAVGIGVGSLYKYYSSKEQLFAEIFFAEGDSLKRSIFDKLDLDDEPVKVSKQIVQEIFTGVRSNPILMEWYNLDTFIKINKKLDLDETGKEHHDFSYRFFIDLIEMWKDKGKIRKDFDSNLILAFFNSLQYIDLHREEIGEQYFPEFFDYMVEFIVRGLE